MPWKGFRTTLTKARRKHKMVRATTASATSIQGLPPTQARNFPFFSHDSYDPSNKGVPPHASTGCPTVAHGRYYRPTQSTSNSPIPLNDPLGGRVPLGAARTQPSGGCVVLQGGSVRCRLGRCNRTPSPDRRCMGARTCGWDGSKRRSTDGQKNRKRAWCGVLKLWCMLEDTKIMCPAAERIQLGRRAPGMDGEATIVWHQHCFPGQDVLLYLARHSWCAHHVARGPAGVRLMRHLQTPKIACRLRCESDMRTHSGFTLYRGALPCAEYNSRTRKSGPGKCSTLQRRRQCHTPTHQA